MDLFGNLSRIFRPSANGKKTRRRQSQLRRENNRRLFTEPLEDRKLMACVADCSGFLTYSQGGYGAVNGGPSTYLSANFDSAFPEGVQLGSAVDGAASDGDTSAGARAVLFTSASAIIEWLPHGGPSGALGADAVDPASNTPNLDGSLAAQTLTMMLNIGFDAAEPLFDGHECNPQLGTLIYSATDATSVFNDMSVQEIVDEANRVLSGADPSNAAFTASLLTVALSNMVDEFHLGATDGDPDVTLSCPEVDEEVTLTIEGFKYNDHNANGQQDAGEEGLAGWQFTVWVDSNGDGLVTDGETTSVESQAGGGFSYSVEVLSSVLAGGIAYDVDEILLGGQWVATQGADGYTGSFTTELTSVDVDFGNTNVGIENGKTIGFWSNKNGQALITQSDLAVLRSLNLRNANGTNFDPTTASQVKSFLVGSTGATATNMANMLSAQFAATILNSLHGFFGDSQMIYVEGALESWSGNSDLAMDLNSGSDPDLVNQFGFASINDLTMAANDALGSNSIVLADSAMREYLEALKTTFDGMNNNLAIFVQ